MFVASDPSRHHAGRRQLPVLRVPGAGALLQPRPARAPVPPETPGILRGDVSGPKLPHFQRKEVIFSSDNVNLITGSVGGAWPPR